MGIGPDNGGTGLENPTPGMLMLTNGDNPFLVTDFPWVDFVNKLFGVGTASPRAKVDIVHSLLASHPTIPAATDVIIEAQTGTSIILHLVDRLEEAGYVVGDQDRAISGGVSYDNDGDFGNLIADGLDRVRWGVYGLRVVSSTGALQIPMLGPAPSPPPPGYISIYALAADSLVYYMLPDGTATAFGSGGGGGGPSTGLVLTEQGTLTAAAAAGTQILQAKTDHTAYLIDQLGNQRKLSGPPMVDGSGNIMINSSGGVVTEW